MIKVSFAYFLKEYNTDAKNSWKVGFSDKCSFFVASSPWHSCTALYEGLVHGSEFPGVCLFVL